MGNNSSSNATRLKSKDKLEWCELSNNEIENFCRKFNIPYVLTEDNLNGSKIRISDILKSFAPQLRDLYKKIIMESVNINSGELTLQQVLKCIDNLLYSNKKGICNTLLEQAEKIISNETDILRISLTVLLTEMDFLLREDGDNWSDSINDNGIHSKDDLISVIKDVKFEFVVREYHRYRSSSEGTNSSKIGEFLYSYFPLFSTLIKLAFRVHLGLISHPHNIQGAFQDKRRSMVTLDNEMHTKYLETSDQNWSTPDKLADSLINTNKLSNWLDISSRILSPENCCVIRSQYYGDISSGEFMTMFQPWNLLYASWKHGLSLQRLISNIQGYSAHVLFIIRTIDDCIFGALCPGNWKEGNGKYEGDETCFLLCFKPTLSILRQTGIERNFMYLNTKYGFSPKGIGFGGEPQYARIWLDPSLVNGTCMRSDLTYKSGMLYLPSRKNSKRRSSCLLLGTAEYAGNDEALTDIRPFKVAEIEVWGLGDSNIYKDYIENKATDHYFRQERKAIDKSKFLKNEFDKEFLLSKTFSKGTSNI
ncbi:TLD domain-containing protein [Cryptosporidium muris RN66]|uniref:TLD domain-containing protein n=1 Tax=Cryptosporidium muris (strain RN66) TaxID=441375 RepID=B6AG57_CRYMR|nr:TLD domain-containing protein [Cryptosporidium muris RN66]EEA07198.1 TLD domain-containing protein [Cryptosporidium muris RN66]|eukprot:XP_002141547.1 TLD domain-containing protein [Cryptosporidium muris RN66]